MMGSVASYLIFESVTRIPTYCKKKTQDIDRSGSNVDQMMAFSFRLLVPRSRRIDYVSSPLHNEL